MPSRKTTDRARKEFVSTFSHDPRQLSLPFIPVVPTGEPNAEDSNASKSISNGEKINIPTNNHCVRQTSANTDSQR